MRDTLKVNNTEAHIPIMDLVVPFAEKDEAKHLGAKWDSVRKVWFVPDGQDLRRFERWLPKEPTIGFLSNTYFIAESTSRCWKCESVNYVYGFILPTGHEVLGSGRTPKWYRQRYPWIVYYVADLIPSVQETIKDFSNNYRLDYSKTTENSYWMNHCNDCGAKLGDFHMYCEPYGAFCPVDPPSAARITLYHIEAPFGCNGEADDLDGLFRFMRQA